VLDSKLERDIGLGRQFPGEVLGPKEIFLTKSTLRYLDLDPETSHDVKFMVDIRLLATYVVDGIKLTDGKLSKADFTKFLQTLDINLDQTL